MKNTFLFLLMALPLISYAQVKTGGGTVIDPNDPEYGDGGGSDNSAVVNMQIYMKHLKKQERRCGEGKQELIKSKDMMKAYMALTVFKTLRDKQDPQNPMCKRMDAFISCLNDSESKTLYKNYANSPGAVSDLKARYGISEDEAKKMIKFFENFEHPEDK